MTNKTDANDKEISETFWSKEVHSQITLDEIDKVLNNDMENPGFPSLDNESEWNTLPNGSHSSCKNSLIVDICYGADLSNVLEQTLAHITDVCSNTESIAFIVSIKKNEWRKISRGLDKKIIGRSPNIKIKTIHLDNLSMLVNDLKNNSSIINFLNWLAKFKTWSPFAKIRFELALAKLSGDYRFELPRKPKVVGRYSTLPYYELIIVYYMPGKKELKDLRFKNDGTEYSIMDADGWCRVII